MEIEYQRQSIESAVKLLDVESTTLEKFESIRTSIRGVNPKIDKALDACSRALSTLKKLQEGEIIELAAENLPEDTEDAKKRKKALLLFIRTWKQLQSEVERVKGELEKGSGSDESKSARKQVDTFAKIAAFAKGPFGIITILALVITGILAWRNQGEQSVQIATLASATPLSPPLTSPSLTPTPVGRSKIQVISYNGKKIPLSQLSVRTGPDCTNSPREAPHYHAKNGLNVKATDGTIIADPGSCAFGKLDEATVEEIESP